MQIQTGFLANRFWLWVGILLSTAAVIAYIVHAPPNGRDGSTIVGYGLGGLSGLLVLYLAWFGIRKRRFASSSGRRRDVVSAHVFLGLTLIATATLHTGFEFEFSIHTLTYVLLVLVVLSGIWGVTVYANLPDRMSRNLSEMIVEKKRNDMSNLEQLEEDLHDLDARLERSLQRLPDDFRGPIRMSLEKTKIGGGLFSILSGSSKGCASAKAFDQIRTLTEDRQFSNEERRHVTQMMADLARKREVAACLRRDCRYRGLLSIWLWLHVPLTSALIVTLIAHVLLVFFYW